MNAEPLLAMTSDSSDDRDLAARISEPAAIRKFLLAGNAYCTFRSEKTGNHLTYNVSARKDASPQEVSLHFVRVLCGPDHYEYLGTIRGGSFYSHGRKSRIGPEATSAKAFAWLWKHLSGGRMPPECEVWHEGKCARCARRLTTPESCASGIGPECAKKLEAGL
jgi:hypothetical protein